MSLRLLIFVTAAAEHRGSSGSSSPSGHGVMAIECSLSSWHICLKARNKASLIRSSNHLCFENNGLPPPWEGNGVRPPINGRMPLMQPRSAQG